MLELSFQKAGLTVFTMLRKPWPKKIVKVEVETAPQAQVHSCPELLDVSPTLILQTCGTNAQKGERQDDWMDPQEFLQENQISYHKIRIH